MRGARPWQPAASHARVVWVFVVWFGRNVGDCPKAFSHNYLRDTLAVHGQPVLRSGPRRNLCPGNEFKRLSWSFLTGVRIRLH